MKNVAKSVQKVEADRGKIESELFTAKVRLAEVMNIIFESGASDLLEKIEASIMPETKQDSPKAPPALAVKEEDEEEDEEEEKPKPKPKPTRKSKGK